MNEQIENMPTSLTKPDEIQLYPIGAISRQEGEPTTGEDGEMIFPPSVLVDGWHINATDVVKGWDKYRVEPKTPYMQIGGVKTVFYRFKDEAEFVAVHATTDFTIQPDIELLKKHATDRIDAQHAAVLLEMTGNPTEVERSTWTGKVALAEAIKAGETLTASQVSFLAMLGVKEAGKAAYAESVLAKSAKYWQLVGFADRIRSESKDRIKLAKSAQELDKAIETNKVMRDAAIAKVMGALQ